MIFSFWKHISQSLKGYWSCENLRNYGLKIFTEKVDWHHRAMLSCISYYSWYYLELVAGWAAAVLNDSEEFDFINQHERRVADRSYYWIGGLAYDTLESRGYSSGISHRELSKVEILQKHKEIILPLFPVGWKQWKSWNENQRNLNSSNSNLKQKHSVTFTLT